MRHAPLSLEVAATATLGLAPVLLAQGLLVQRRVPRLPAAGGPTSGRVAGRVPAVRLLVVGESTVAGVGAATHDAALAGQLAQALAARTDRAVDWRAAGQIGVTAGMARALVPSIPTAPVDLALVALGVNDCLRFHSPRRWAAELTRLIAVLRERVGRIPIFLAAVPPLGRFPALPQPLRGVLGLRAQLLDAASARLAPRLPAVTHLPLSLPVTPALFCADGFHPGPAGYQAWARLLAAPIAAALAAPPAD